MSDIEATHAEKKAIKALKRLARNWPTTLWLFAGSGPLCVMRKGKRGEQVHLPTDGVDPAYHLDSINIDNDGGDW